jgi:adenylate cyclase
MIIGGPPLVPSPSKAQEQPRPEARAVTAQLEKILASADFDASPRSRAFIRFIVDETLAGRQEALTQADIATRVFGRRDDFDPTVDPIVRIQAGRLRRSLERYYLLSGAGDTVRIELPRGTYVPVLGWGPSRVAESRQSEASRASAPTDDWPRVVVDRFENASGDPEVGAAVVRCTHQLALELDRYLDVRVVLLSDQREPHTSACEHGRFALSGQISLSKKGVGLTARLLDCRTANQVWAQEYRGGLKVSSEFCEQTARVIAARIASEQGVIAQRLWVEQRNIPPARLTPYGAILRSYQFFFNRNPADLAPAVEALQQAVAAEPECGLAWVQLSRLYSANHAFEVAPVDTPIDLAAAHAEQGVRLEPTNQRAGGALAFALFLKGEMAASRKEAQRALDLDPESLVYLEALGWLMTLLGDDQGPAMVREAVAQNPHVLPLAFFALWADHLRRREVEAAYQAALEFRDPAYFWRALMRACCLGHLGKGAEAKAEAAELLRQKPDFASRGRTLIGRLIRFPDLFETVVDGLRKAGLELA